MAAMIEQYRHFVEISSTVNNICKAQDFTEQGSGVDFQTGEEFQWALLNDGHGTHSCIDFIREIPLAKKAEFIGSLSPVDAFTTYIDQSGCVLMNESSGATMIIVKIYHDRAVCISIGDSTVTVFKDGALVYKNPGHNCANPAEVGRVNGLGFKIVPASNIRILAPNMIEPCSALYMLFPGESSSSGRRLACTQALGHNSLTGYLPEIHTIQFDQGSN